MSTRYRFPSRVSMETAAALCEAGVVALRAKPELVRARDPPGGRVNSGMLTCVETNARWEGAESWNLS